MVPPLLLDVHPHHKVQQPRVRAAEYPCAA